MVASASHLEIPLMTAERAWAYGMQRKQETADAPYRVRRHVTTRLAKAAKVTKTSQSTRNVCLWAYSTWRFGGLAAESCTAQQGTRSLVDVLLQGGDALNVVQ